MTKKSRIAIMVPVLYNGGAEKVAADLSIYFEQKGYEVIIFCEGRQKLKEYQHGGRIICVERTAGFGQEKSKVEFLSNLMRDASIYRELKKKYKIDVTISFMQVLNLLNILSRYNDKVIVTLHSVMSYRTDLNQWFGYGNRIFRYLYQLADKIVFVSKFCQKDWINHYGDLFSKTTVIQNPVDTVVQHNYIEREAFQWDFGSNAVISVARLDGVKQQWHLIRAFKKVLHQCHDAQLLIAGDGTLKEALRFLSVQLGINDHVHFIGYVNHIDRYLQKCKVLAITSASESWCNAIAEAMVQGVPVVTNDCPGGIRELIGAVRQPESRKQNVVVGCGIITPKLDGKKYAADVPLTREESLLADGILRLLEDHDLRQKMSQACVENVKKYDLENIGEKWEREVEKLKFRKQKGNIIGRCTVFFCAVAGGMSSILTRKRKEGTNQATASHAVKEDKFAAYYRILDQWMLLKEEGIKVEQYFLDHKFNKIAIYGIAKLANHLVKELETSNIQIIYGIDRNSDMIYGKFPVISVEAILPDADVIVVTPTTEYEDIKKDLQKRIECPIVSLEEIIFFNRK